MWIMLIKKIPVEVSPPKLSIFWSTPWPKKERPLTKKQRKLQETMLEDFGDVWGGQEPDFSNARRINYRGTDVRVFPHEFTTVNPSNLRLYIEGVNGNTSHFLVPHEASREIMRFFRHGTRDIYEAALLDGATYTQAELVEQGHNVSAAALEFPPIGWYKPYPEYALYFCQMDDCVEKHPDGDNDDLFAFVSANADFILTGE